MINAIKKAQRTSLIKWTAQMILDSPTIHAIIKAMIPKGILIVYKANAIAKALTVWRLGKDSPVLWPTSGSILNVIQGRGRL